MSLPLRRGSDGEPVRDLQSRLAALGWGTDRDEPGLFGEGTEAAVRAFQQQRGLRVDGICGAQTWAAVVEAGYRPGDRLLYNTRPPFRGDDVADLQRRLGALGFDAGRVDGIFGEQTQRAVLEFQRNVGLSPDGICGPTVLSTLARVAARTDAPEHVACVRERESLRRSPPTLQGRRVVVGETGGLSALADAAARQLKEAGADVVTLSHPEGSAHAAQANGLDAQVYVGLAAAEDGCCIAYYAAHGFESPGGRRLAEHIAQELGTAGTATVEEPRGMALPVLRETRMPAVVCELGPPPMVVEQGAALATALKRALTAWAQALEHV